MPPRLRVTTSFEEPPRVLSPPKTPWRRPPLPSHRLLRRRLTSRLAPGRLFLCTVVVLLFYYHYCFRRLDEPTASSHDTPLSDDPHPSFLADAICTTSETPPSIYKSGEFFRFTNQSISENPALAIFPFPPPKFTSKIPPRWDAPELPLTCLDVYIAHGHPCGDMTYEKLDVVWPYTNSSDALVQDAFHANRRAAWPKGNPPAPKDSSLREFDELRHSVRSMLMHFGDAGRFLLVTPDIPLPGCGGWRVGQHPRWLAQDGPIARDGSQNLEVVHHSNIFPSLGNQTTFNTYSVESRFHHIPNITKYYINMHDGFFANAELLSHDFYSHAFGPIFRFNPEAPVEWKSTVLDAEWLVLTYTNDLLNLRFGKRPRPNISHTAKTLGSHFIREIESVWYDEMATTASHSFPSDFDRDPDLDVGFFMTHYVVERWREALLWSFFVGSIGGDDDQWDGDRAWQELGGMAEHDEIKVVRGPRDTLHQLDERLVANGVRPKTHYTYSSLDGYPLSNYDKTRFKKFPDFRKQNSPKKLHHDPATSCTISSKACFTLPGDVPSTASEVFKNAAFRHPECGDCMIDALVTKSGRRGLEAFLPKSSRKSLQPASSFFGAASTPPTPRLPLSRYWRTTDFSLKSVMGRTDLTVREWVEQAMLRYRFIIGHTNVKSITIHSYNDMDDVYDMDQDPPTMIGLEDDVVQDEGYVHWGLAYWFAEKWPLPAQWEVEPPYYNPAWYEDGEEGERRASEDIIDDRSVPEGSDGETAEGKESELLNRFGRARKTVAGAEDAAKG